MKKLLISMLMCLPIMAAAQNDWEIPDEPQPVTPTVTNTVNPHAKYLAGAVPVVNGKVVFETQIAAPGKSATDIYRALLSLTERMTKGGEAD